MAHYIDKDALVEKIERRTKYNHERAYLDKSSSMAGRESEDKDILSLIDSLEVKEVDLEKELDLWMELNQDDAGYFNTLKLAEHFFELGLKA